MHARPIKPIRNVAAAVLALSMVILGSGTSAHAEGNQADPFTESKVETFSSAEVESELAPAEAPGNAQEKAAVSSYVAEQQADGVAVDARDLQVGTLAVDDDVHAVVVAPEYGVEIQSIRAIVDAGSNEVSVGARVDTDETHQASQGGPGMAGSSWPAWVDQPSYQVQMKLYDGNDYLGRALFETKKRKLQNDGTGARDTWQVARWAQGTPQELNADGGSVDINVKKLWVSSDLTDNSQGKAQQTLISSSSPAEGSQSCNSGNSATVGPFSFTWQDCSDYDVWYGNAVSDVAHMRFDYDQGNWSGGNTRAIAYLNTFTVDDGHTPSFTWYEFVTLRAGKWAGSPSFKCTYDGRGTTGTTEDTRCNF